MPRSFETTKEISVAVENYWGGMGMEILGKVREFHVV